MKPYNVLVFPGGTEIGLEIGKSLSQCKEIQLFSGGENASDHAPYAFARHFLTPSVYQKSWIERLNEIVSLHKIDYIFPAHDDVVLALAENRDQIKTKIVSSPVGTCLVSRFKSKTYKLFEGILPIPKVYSRIEEIKDFPVFVKPDKGQGSQFTHIVHRREYLRGLLKEKQNFIIMEYLPGEEYTVDCFSDRQKGLLFCGPRERLRIRNGISMNSCAVKGNADLFHKYAEAISQKLAFYGAWFFQLKRDGQGTYKLLEVAPRIAGTMAYHRVLGVNFPLLSLYEQERIPLEILVNKIDVEIDRALMNRCRHSLVYDKVYLDLDDTLLFKNAVNTHLIQFVYQCINRKIPVILMTKHAGDIQETLKKYRLTGLFEGVLLIDPAANKTDSIQKGEKAIFIDDSFSERLAASRRLGIPTFDCSMIEMLIDERV